jgi:transposase
MAADQMEMLKGADFFSHGFLPAAAAYCRRLSLVELVDRMVPTQMELRPGLAVQAMVLDVLQGRNPLYRVEHSMARTDMDMELLLGEKVEPHMFNDTNLSRSLDAIFDAGPSKIITALGIGAASAFDLDMSALSYDTTSTSVWGEYRGCELPNPPQGPVITHGHSKDHQPQLKQFMTELLCVERGVPIFGRTLDGNSSDKTSNNHMLARISTLMAAHGLGPGACVYVADSAMVTERNLEILGDMRFITRLPANYSVCDMAIQQAVIAKEWTALGRLAETSGGVSRPSAEYRSHEAAVVLHGKSYRAVVIHSSTHDKRRQKKLAKSLAASEKALKDKLKQVQVRYFCEADASAAAAQAAGLSTRLHMVVTKIQPVEVRRPGRPPKEGPAPTTTRYHLCCGLVENIAEAQREKDLAGCFVLLTNVPSEGQGALDAKGILRTYKGQYGIESDFAFLKDPLIVNDLFLKTPSRIDALGMILIIALMVWRLMERSMRAHVQNNKITLQGWDNKQTEKPTAFMMTTVLTDILVILVNGNRSIVRGIDSRRLAFLKALGLGPPAFLDPQCQCVPIIPLKSTSKG